LKRLEEKNKTGEEASASDNEGGRRLYSPKVNMKMMSLRIVTRAECFFSPSKKKKETKEIIKQKVSKKKKRPNLYISDAYVDPCGSRVLMNS